MTTDEKDTMVSVTERPERPLHELLSNSMADIYVGPDSQHWILHEKLLCHWSPVLRGHFYKKGSRSSTYGLPDDSIEAFRLLVGWLYSSGTLHFPLSESELSPLLDAYLLARKLEMAALESDIVDTVRAYYQHTGTYPGLRRVQYVYANTEQDNPMREMMVGAVARQLTLAESIPSWWAKALRNNGELAVDIIRAIQEWHLESRSVPDIREGMEQRNVGLSNIEEISMDGESQSKLLESHEPEPTSQTLTPMQEKSASGRSQTTDGTRDYSNVALGNSIMA